MAKISCNKVYEISSKCVLRLKGMKQKENLVMKCLKNSFFPEVCICTFPVFIFLSFWPCEYIKRPKQMGWMKSSLN